MTRSETEDFYRNVRLSKHSYSEADLLRMEETLALLPEGMNSALDVGCGEGYVLKELARQGLCPEIRLGLDLNLNDLRRSEESVLCASIASLPFRDRSWDCLFCLEVLEHLTDEIYQAALAEFQRVVRHEIILSVPNAEDLRTGHIECPRCLCRFNLSRHVRSFRAESLEGLFGDAFSLAEVRTVYPERRIYFHGVAKAIARRLGLVDSFHPVGVCPLCGYRRPSSTSTRELLRVSGESTKTMAFAKKVLPGWTTDRWLLARFSRRV